MVGISTENQNILFPQYNNFKYVLFFKIHLQNPKRSDILSELTMDEFESRTHENNQVRIHVSNHKTDYKYGSSVITLED